MSLDLSRWFAGIVGPRRSDVPVCSSPEMDARVREAVDALPVTLFEFDSNGIYTCVAGGYIGLFGITAETLIGRSIFEYPKFVPGKNVMARRALAGESVSFTGIWPRGRFMIRFVPRFDERRRVKGVVGLGFELTKPAANDKYFEELLEALRKSEARFRAMCDCAPLGICVTNPSFELGYVNPSLCALLDRRPDELLGRSWEAVLHADERERVRHAREISRAAPPQGVLHLVRRDGADVFASLRMAAMRDDGELLGYVAVLADVTQERAARLAIDRVQEDLRRVIESSPEGIAVVRGARWIFLNRALVEALGYPSAEALVGREVAEIVHPDDRVRACALVSQPPELAGGELRYRCAGGEYVLLELRPAPLAEFEGAPAVLLSARDITEQKKLQARLLATERLLSVGTLAAGVAHEINNPLAAALTNLEWVAAQLTRSAATGGAAGASLRRLERPVAEAREACERVRAIVRDLKLFSRAEEELLGPVDLTQVLDSAVRMAWNELRHRARLVREYGDLPRVRGNEARLGQVFLNLLINAAQALPDGSAAAHEIRITARALPTREVAVEVRDSGCGIEEELLDRVFDPFFTTKPGVGTGLGLSICQRIVTSLGGHIEVESQPGRGSTFRVTLASLDGPRPAPAAEPAPERPTMLPRGRLLVIDDDSAVGRALELVLAEEHEVELFTSARQALARLRDGARYDVVLCDVMMPEMSGIELHRELSLSHPALAAQMIFLTGGTFTLGAREFLDRVPNARLGKPFDWQALKELIHDRLSGEC